MMSLYLGIDVIFGISQFINASLFLVQLVMLFQKRSANDISLIMFLGFVLMQMMTILYGYLNGDSFLIYGAALSFCLGISVIITALYFRLQNNNAQLVNSNEPNLQDIMALIPANVYWLDKKGTFLGCNNRVLSMLNLKSLDAYRGKTYEDFYETNHIQMMKAVDDEVMTKNRIKTIEEVSVHARKTYLTNKIPLHNKYGHVIGLLAVSMDVSDMRKREKVPANENECPQLPETAFARAEFL